MLGIISAAQTKSGIAKLQLLIETESSAFDFFLFFFLLLIILLLLLCKPPISVIQLY